MFDKYNKSQYPNLAAEIHAHRYCYSSFADHGNIKRELLEAFLNGEEQITPAEARSMARLSNDMMKVRFSPDYLLAPTFAYYNMRKKKHYRKVMEVLRRCDKVRQAVDIQQMYAAGGVYRADWDRLTKEAIHVITAEQAAEYVYISRVVLNRALRYAADLEELAAQRAIPKPRGLTKKAVELTA